MKRTVVITGGTSGLGREMTLAFGRAGYSVVALYSSDDAAAGHLRVSLEQAGIEGCVVRHDVTSDEDAVWMRPEIQDAESLTFIHNACARFSPTPMHQLRWPEVARNLDVAVKGGWLCAQALIRPMLKTGRGTIVNILTSAIEGSPPKGFAAYAVAKHALRGLTLALAAEYAPRGVRIFSASPGFMGTPLTAQWDVRMREAIQSASSRVTMPTEASSRLVELVGSTIVAGQGEDYPI